MKIAAIPFLVGATGFSYFAETGYAFPIDSAIVLTILLLTKQVKLI